MMAISIVTFGEKELELIKDYIPEEVLTGFGVTHIFGAVDGKEIKGFEVVRQTDENAAVLTWIYVFDEYRRQGIGNALLDYISKQVGEEADNVLLAEYPNEIESGNILDYMFAKRNFEVWQDTIWIGEIDRYQLKNTFLADQNLQDDFAGDIYRLEEVPVSALNDFLDKNESLVIHDVDIYSADKVLSLVLAKNGKLRGIMLVAPGEGYGHYVITNLYVDNKAVALVVGFLSRAMDYLINTDELIRKLSFLVQEKQSKNFIDRVLSNLVVWEEGYVKRASLTEYIEV